MRSPAWPLFQEETEAVEGVLSVLEELQPDEDTRSAHFKLLVPNKMAEMWGPEAGGVSAQMESKGQVECSQKVRVGFREAEGSSWLAGGHGTNRGGGQR